MSIDLHGYLFVVFLNIAYSDDKSSIYNYLYIIFTLSTFVLQATTFVIILRVF